MIYYDELRIGIADEDGVPGPLEDRFPQLHSVFQILQRPLAVSFRPEPGPSFSMLADQAFCLLQEKAGWRIQFKIIVGARFKTFDNSSIVITQPGQQQDGNFRSCGISFHSSAK